MRKFFGLSIKKIAIALFALPALFFITGMFTEMCYAAGKIPSDLLLQKILVTKDNNGKYLIWLKFNNTAKQLNPTCKLYNYGFKLKFPNTGFHFKSKFLKYSNNPLISGIELIRSTKRSADVMVYFKKGIKIDKKRLESSSYKNYYIIKFNRSFAANIFQNIGKKTSRLSKLALLKNSFKNVKKPLKNKSALNKAALFNNKTEQDSKTNQISQAEQIGQAKKTNNKIDKTVLNKQPAAMNFNFGLEIIKTIFSLLLVLGFIYAIYYLLTKFKGKISNIKKNKNNIRIISSVNIGFKKSLILASVNNQLFLIGVSPTNMQVIGHIKEDENNTGFRNDAEDNNDAPNIDMMAGINHKSVNYSKNTGKSSGVSNTNNNNNNNNNDDKDIAIGKGNAGKFLNNKAPASINNFSSFLKQHISALSKDKNKNKEPDLSHFEAELEREAIVKNIMPKKNAASYSGYSGFSNNNNKNNINNSDNNGCNYENENYNQRVEESLDYKIRNISEARIKNKADNVFFDIENKIKGLMESNNGNFKKN
jgi:flagellar biosynthetic protein FliO